MPIVDILDTVFQDHLTRDQRLVLESAATRLDMYEAKGSACFRDAAGLVRQGCKGLDVREGDKVKCKVKEASKMKGQRYGTSSLFLARADAVHLTRCEIATASIPIPVECTAEAAEADVYACVEWVLLRILVCLEDVIAAEMEAEFCPGYLNFGRHTLVMSEKSVRDPRK
ncbi:hypothetical protein HKX48_005515 [Thoreauomyces humboldtii]|nr:hypothetical protein HKX48_005515 [Thoreauomyces humboldtii]